MLCVRRRSDAKWATSLPGRECFFSSLHAASAAQQECSIRLFLSATAAATVDLIGVVVKT
jgi:hypothetical protein